MWSTDFDDFPSDTPRKRRKVETKSKTVVSHVVGNPQSVEELATHSRKIAEVREWLLNAGQKSNILLLTGPSGTAKSTTLRIVAANIGLEVQEWVNPVDKVEYNLSNWLELDPFDSSKYSEPKQSEKFDAFVFRSSRYRSLFSVNSSRILLVEDFPNHFIWKPQEFHNFLASYKISGQCPIVFICTDDEKLNLSNDLFPNHIRTSFHVTNIKFNPVSHSALMKVLHRNVGGKAVPKDILEAIARSSNGDVRTALSTLRFSLTAKSSGKATLGAVLKDTNTEFYQTLGRVLYPKRLEGPNESKRTFVHDVSSIAEHFNNTFLSMIQENFLDTYSSLPDITKACEILSDCDILDTRANELKEYAGLICVVGLMTYNRTTKTRTFKPLRKSRWSDLMRYEKQESRNPYPHLHVTRRTLNLDLIPFLKYLPSQSFKLSSSDLDRLPFESSSKRGSSNNHVFKVPSQRPPPLTSSTDELDTDEMLIEEYDD